MSPLDALLRLVLLPGAICAGAGLLGMRLARRSPRARDACLALGLAAGFVAALYACGVRPSLPLAPSDSTWRWVVWLALAGALAGIGLHAVRARPLESAALVGLLGATGTWLVLRPLVPHAVASEAVPLRVLLGGVVAAALHAASSRPSPAGGASSTGAWLVALAGAAGVFYLLSSAAVMAAAAGTLAIAVAVTAAVAGRAPRMRLPIAAVPAVALVFVGMLVAAHGTLTYGSRVLFPAETAILLAASAACGAIRRWPLAVAGAVAAAGAAAWLAYARVGAVRAPVW